MGNGVRFAPKRTRESNLPRIDTPTGRASYAGASYIALDARGKYASTMDPATAQRMGSVRIRDAGTQRVYTRLDICSPWTCGSYDAHSVSHFRWTTVRIQLHYGCSSNCAQCTTMLMRIQQQSISTKWRSWRASTPPTECWVLG